MRLQSVPSQIEAVASFFQINGIRDLVALGRSIELPGELSKSLARKTTCLHWVRELK